MKSARTSARRRSPSPTSSPTGERWYAFEPFPANVERLTRNAEQSLTRNIEVLPLALGERNTTVQFAAPRADNSGLGYVVDARAPNVADVAPTQLVEVACRKLDDLRNQLRPPRLIVIDAEGHEASILRGAEQLLTRDRPVIVLEALEHLLARAGTDPLALGRLLTGFGYRLVEIRRFTLAPIDVEAGAVPEQSDWLGGPHRGR